MQSLKPERSRPSDDHLLPLPAARAFDSHSAITRANRWLVAANLATGIALVVCCFVLLSIFTRPPAVMSGDRGYMQYHTTEWYRLNPEILSAYIEMVLGKAFNLTPGFYDPSSLLPFVAPEVFTGLTESNSTVLSERIRRDIRQVFGVYEIREFQDPSWPNLRSYLVKGERTRYERRTDSAGNVIFSPSSQIVYYSVYLREVPPSPSNPFGLLMVGVVDPPQLEVDATWPSAQPINAISAPQ